MSMQCQADGCEVPARYYSANGVFCRSHEPGPVTETEADRLRAENGALRAACRQACVAMSLKYGYDRGTLEQGYEEVMDRYGGGMAYAYEMLRRAINAATAPAARQE